MVSLDLTSTRDFNDIMVSACDGSGRKVRCSHFGLVEPGRPRAQNVSSKWRCD